MIENSTIQNNEKTEIQSNFKDLQIFWILSVPTEKLEFISPECKLITGYDESDFYLNPKLWLNLIQQRTYKKVSRTIQDNRIYFESTYTIQNKSGKKYFIQETIIPVIDDNDQLIQLNGISKVVNSFSMEENESFERLPFPIFNAVKFDNQWIIVNSSRSFQELIQTNSKNIYITEDSKNEIIQKVFKALKELEKNSDITKFDISVQNKDEIKLFRFEIKVIERNTKSLTASGWGYETTEFIQNENRLRKLNNDKNKLLSIVSHDLKAPFSSIINFINLINEGIEIDEEQRKEYLKFIYDSAKQQLEMIHELLELSKIESGLMEYSPNYFDLLKITKKVLSSFAGHAFQKQINFEIEIPKNTQIFFDKNYLRIVLNNIISNAIKFSHRGGKIIIKAEDESNFTTLIVQDFGIGFSERYIQQLNSKNIISQIGTMGEKGTGLGLKFCYDLITSNNGQIKIDSKVQHGTTITLKFRKPKINAVYFSDEISINHLRNISQNFLPDTFLYLCLDVFDLVNFIENVKPDYIYLNLDIMKSFQKSFLERIFSDLKENTKIIGFTSQGDSGCLSDIININKIYHHTSAKEKITEILKQESQRP